MRPRGRGISVVGRITILVGMVLQGLVIASQAEDPGPLQWVGTLAAGFILAAVSWAIFAAAYEVPRGRR